MVTMANDDHFNPFEPEPEEPSFLVGSNGNLTGWLKTCPAAQTLTGYSETLDQWVLIALCCRKWGCPICGRKKLTHYARRVADAKPNRFITLTCWTRLYENPRQAFDLTRRKVGEFAQHFRRQLGEFEFFRVLEATEAGWPHYHLITRSPYIPHKHLLAKWQELTGNKIVHVKAIDKATNAYWYTVKYLGKQYAVPWTTRRAAWSRHFFPPSQFEAGPSLNLMNQEFEHQHPANYIRWNHEGATLVRETDTMWLINPR